MFNHILVPVAPSHIGENAKAMALAKSSLAAGGKISVLSVVEVIPTYAEVQLPANYLAENLKDISDGLGKEFNDDGVEIHAISGHSANSILDWAEEHSVDCIAMSSHLPGFSDYFIGSTAAKVVRHAQCSVLILR